MIKKHDKEQFTKQLLAWYDIHKRALPWRDQPLPYYVWVSEIMLQQTRVEAVKPYFQRFISALPTLDALAQCEDDVLTKLWEGLGYYNRVRNMKKCAIKCMEDHKGALPNTYEELLQLPGIGTYTAGAIASIAYKQKVPAVDGNVLRVFSRVLVSEADISKERTKKHFQQLLQAYLPKRVDAFNQALMDLGATICVANTTPRCNICPVANTCMGYQNGQANRLPIKKSKKARRIEKKTICVIISNNKVHIMQRSKEGLLASLYEFDAITTHVKKEEVLDYVEKLGTLKHIHSLPNAKHIFSHIEWHMKGWLIELKDVTQTKGWVCLEDLQTTYAIPSAYIVYKKACIDYLQGVEHDTNNT